MAQIQLTCLQPYIGGELAKRISDLLLLGCVNFFGIYDTCRKKLMHLPDDVVGSDDVVGCDDSDHEPESP